MAGKKGKSGRKSAYQEIADATEAYRIFTQDNDQEELESKIASGKFSIKDRFILNAMEGDAATVMKAYHKAVPDNIDLTSGGKPLLISSDE